MERVQSPILQTNFSDQNIIDFRNDTPGCSNVVHLNNAGSGLMPRVVSNAIMAHVQLESDIGGYEAAALQKDVVQEFYHQAALLLNCKPTNIAFTSSATDAYTRALSSIPFREGDIILTSTNDFISNQIQFLSCQKRFGIHVVRVADTDSGEIDLNDLHEKLHTLRPRLLSITHIPTNSGLIQPVEAIGKIVKAYRDSTREDTWYILDACQSIGQLQLDVDVLHCDFLSVTARKFLRGPRGTGFLFISDRALRSNLEPLFLDMRGAEWISKDRYQIREDATRFEDWEFAYALVLGTSEAIKYYLSIDQHKITTRVQQLSNYTRQQLAGINGTRVLDEGKEKGGLVTFTIDGQEPTHLVNELSKRKINVVPSYRNFAVMDFDKKKASWALRASPHYYNTHAEIDEFVHALATILK
ncbi:aminotransferase class V-fold PLP-dependent enzyme [Pseudochryseolinea flava]|uniref:Aminotransferase class V-fold PLP-dependent enzyme n=1 Tax=Pseudochryseolinea flava TaxID=2059302 RepID=A0A364Y3B9_9BACT|nr:aminotransferase class V-fold PLP-dependent enzyme [Pseudochryseolinea flava]RAW00844.1 aminotransferase class V-fold PLP-dependent enzyme [Pseudochryseolinea flava]